MNVATPTLNILSLCSGVCGLDLGVDLATGGSSRVVCHVEREAFAAAILASRMADKAVAAAPVWSDLRTFDGRPWRGVVDCVVGGYPCQPFSLAGRRLGQDDPRHLWPCIARILGEVMPSIVFFENVAGHLSLGFDAVRADLTARGYRVAAGLFTAAEVGAPHKRERLFILGIMDHARSADGERDARAIPGTQTGECGTREHDGDLRERLEHAGASLAHSRSQRPQGQRPDGPAAGTTGRGDGALADPAGGWWRIGEPERGADRGATDRGSGDGLGVFPPGPGDRAAWERILAVRPDLAPAISPEIESSLRRNADGTSAGLGGLLTPRLDQLRALGNGVVPQCAALAFVSLWACLREGE